VIIHFPAGVSPSFEALAARRKNFRILINDLSDPIKTLG